KSYPPISTDPAYPHIEFKQPQRKLRKTTIEWDRVHLLDDPLAHVAYKRRSTRDAHVCDECCPVVMNHGDQLLCVETIGKCRLIFYGGEPKVAAKVNGIFRSEHEIQRHVRKTIRPVWTGFLKQYLKRERPSQRKAFASEH